MATFKVGESVLCCSSILGRPETEGVIVEGLRDRMVLGLGIVLAYRVSTKMGTFAAQPHQLRKIQYDGDAPAKWSDSLWKPKHLEKA